MERTVGWSRPEWERLTGRAGLGADLALCREGIGRDGKIDAFEIGRLAARMVAAGAWDDDLPAEWFRAC